MFHPLHKQDMHFALSNFFTICGHKGNEGCSYCVFSTFVCDIKLQERILYLRHATFCYPYSCLAYVQKMVEPVLWDQQIYVAYLLFYYHASLSYCTLSVLMKNSLCTGVGKRRLLNLKLIQKEIRGLCLLTRLLF